MFESNILPDFLTHDCTLRSVPEPVPGPNTSSLRPQSDKRYSPLNGSSERASKLARTSSSGAQSTPQVISNAISNKTNKTSKTKATPCDAQSTLEVLTKAISDSTSNHQPADTAVRNHTTERNGHTEAVTMEVIQDKDLDILSSDNATPAGTRTVSAGSQSVLTVTVNQSMFTGAPEVPHIGDSCSDTLVVTKTKHQASKRTKAEKKAVDWGHLRHRFNFMSAYKHSHIQRLHPAYVPEVTTQHGRGRGTNVDYIFFTGWSISPKAYYYCYYYYFFLLLFIIDDIELLVLICSQ